MAAAPIALSARQTHRRAFILRSLLRAAITMRVRFLVLFGCVLLGTPRSGTGAESWLMDAWRAEDGLPDNVIDAIAQTSDGYLWLGTQAGLVRFDGIRFSRCDHPALKISRVQRLFLDRQDRLWISGESGEIASIASGQVRTFGPAEGVPAGGLGAAAEDAQGRVWFSGRREEGCFYFDGQRFVSSVATNLGLLGSFNSLGFASEGTLYGARLGELWKLFPGEPTEISARFNLTAQQIPMLRPAKSGGLWLIVGKACYRETDGDWRRIAEIPDVSECVEDQHGQLWGTLRQLGRVVGITTNGSVTEHTFTPRSLNVRALFQDREKNWWWSTGSDGLRRFRPRDLELVSNAQNLPANSILAIAADPQQGVWALLGRGLVRIADSENPEPLLLKYQIGFPTSLWVDPDESVWIGGNRSGIFRVADDRLQRFRADPGSTESSARYSALFRSRSGELFLGSSIGLFRWTDNTVDRVILPVPPETGAVDVRAFVQDSKGQVYAATRNHGVWRGSGTNWQQLPVTLPGNDIASLWCDDTDTLWIGVTGHGLCRWRDAQTFSFQHSNPHLPENIYGIIEDQQTNLWFTSAQGIFRAPRAELNAVADGRAIDFKLRQYDRWDGLLSIQCTSGQQPVAARSTDGKLWFATARGLYVTDPQRLAKNPLPPPVVIEQVLIDDRQVWQRPMNSPAPPTNPITLQPHEVRLEFHFTALSLVIPQQNRFRYQLEGLDRTWQEAGTKRVAQYNHIPPGRYRFKVSAANNDGVWNETGAALAVIVLPPWWQTLWFRGFSLGSIALLLFGAYRWRMGQLEDERQAQQEFSRRLIESQEQERQRIAAELHDGLGQSLLVIKSRALLAMREDNLPTQVTAQLDELTAQTGAAIQEVREIARNLRPFQLDELGLTRALRGMITTVTQAAGLKLDLALDPVDGTLPLDLEINFYRIVQELLNNVAKHAQATETQISLHREPQELHLKVTDNGCGFDPSLQRDGFGLRGIAERVRILNGHWSVQSNPGHGTTVEIKLPAITQTAPTPTDTPPNS